MLLLADILHTAIWNGSEMIVWGGFDNIAPHTQTPVGEYNADLEQLDSYNMTADAPARPVQSLAQCGLTAEMIIWGGENFSGYQDSWRQDTSRLRTVGLPPAPPTRLRHDQVIRPSGLAAK